MKKILLNTSLLTILSLSVGMAQTEHRASSTFSSPKKDFLKIENVHSFASLLAMGSKENLKAYHIGLRSIFPHHQIPSSRDLLNSIRNHEQFIGVASQAEALEGFSLGKDSYLLFEETEGHFYIAHAGGLRHFTVNGHEIAGIDNGGSCCFPKLDHFIQSTVLL